MSEIGYVPPYTITDKVVNLISAITEIITKITINDNMSNNPRLRRDNRIRTIHASLAIENNSLSLDQVTDIINGKRILGSPDEICEVKNAFEAYNKLLELDPYADGNGRMDRMWQTLLLYKWKSLFGWLPIETLIWERQDEYYSVLGV